MATNPQTSDSLESIQALQAHVQVPIDYTYTGRPSSSVELWRRRQGEVAISLRILLPSWDRFNVKGRRIDPLRVFLYFVAHELGGMRSDQVLDPGRVYLVREDNEQLVATEREWFRRCTGRARLDWVDQINLWPMVFGVGSETCPAWAEAGYVYVQARAITVQSGKPSG